jgi:predicted metalloendopeptidase
MRNLVKLLSASVLLFPLLYAQDAPAPKGNVAQSKSGTSTQSETAPTGEVRFSPDLLDKDIDPCKDFFAYACSKWIAKNPIPADRSSWGRFNELQQRGEYIVREILEKASAPRSDRSVDEQKIGDYYASCMDEAAVEKAGTKPLDPDFNAIAALKSKDDLPPEIVRLHRQGNDVLFNFDSGSDFKNASQIIAQADQGGMGMPDRDYYF